MGDYDYLRKYNPRDKSIGKRIMQFMKDAKDMVFGSITPETTDIDSDTNTNTDSIDTTDMPELETKEEAAQRQKGKGLKILTPKQLMTRLPILLNKLQAGHNSQKFKNEIREIVYLLYRSKNLSKTIYNSLMKTLKMETIFMNTLNSKTTESNRFIYQFTDKLSLKNPTKNIALANLSIYYTWKNIKSEYKNNKFKIFAPTWNDEFNLPNGSYSVSDIQDYFEYIHETIAYNSPVEIYVNKIKNRIAFKIKTGYKLQLLTEETMQLLGSFKKVTGKNKDREIEPRLETVEVVLVHCNLVNKNYQQASKVLFTFVLNKQFGQLITITPHSVTMLKTTNAKFSFIDIWFTDQNNRPLEIEDNVNITLMIGIS